MIKPTVGRTIYYKPRQSELLYVHDQPFIVFITHVYEGGEVVNVAGFNEVGQPFQKNHATLAQDREPVEGEVYWMPFQVGQAAKQSQ